MKSSDRPQLRMPAGERQQANALKVLFGVKVKPVKKAAPKLPEAVKAHFYRPAKLAVSLRLDADLLAWLKKDGKGYQTRVNQLLREKMVAELKMK